MDKYKEEFITFLVKSNALKFGDFTLKSGRKAPYFLNVGQFYKGSLITTLGKYYAQAMHQNIKDFNVVFGPAYKGIPLSVATCMQLFEQFKIDMAYSFNRKEAKDHGEGGMIVGAPIDANSKVVIVDDVMTAGTALRESLDLLKKMGDPKIAGVLIAVDRMEKGQGEKSAAQEVKEQLGIQVFAVVNILEIMEFLRGREIDGKIYIGDSEFAAIKAYREQYGV